MNERVRKLRRVSVDTQPRISIERARIETETYKKYEGTMSVPELRATALYEYMRQRKLYIGEGELIVGEKRARRSRRRSRSCAATRWRICT